MRKTILAITILISLILTGCYQVTDKFFGQNNTNTVQQPNIAVPQKKVQKQNKVKQAENCTKLSDLPNEYGCHPSMYCDKGQVCREGLCVEEKDAPNEYGCHPSMICDKGQVCRDGLCVDPQDAPDKYGCHPSVICGNNEVCREGVCIKVCEE